MPRISRYYDDTAEIITAKATAAKRSGETSGELNEDIEKAPEKLVYLSGPGDK